MKKFAAYLITFSFAITLANLAAQAQSKSFEGTITWNMVMAQLGGDTIPMTMNFKAGNIEQEMSMPQGAMKMYIVKANNTRKFYIVMGGAMGMTMDLPDSTPKSAATSAAASQLVKTGKSATIAGHHADEYLLKGASQDLSVWASSDFPKELRESMANSMKDQPHQDEATSGAFKELASKGLMPVRVVMSQNGQTAMSMELVSFEQKSLPDALFVPPSNIQYRPMPTQMGQGGGGMQGDN